MGIVAYDVLIEKAIGAVVRRGSKPYEETIKIVEYLLPDIVNRAVAFVNDDKIEKLDGHFGIISHWHRGPFLP